MDQEHLRWETRYGVSEYIFGKDPNYFLSRHRALLPKSGRALAIADGEGRNGVWLAQQGLHVHAIDFSAAGQNKARALAEERGVRVQFELADVHRWDFPDSLYDVVCDVFTQFSSPAARSRKWAGVRKALKPGGLFVLVGYSPKQLEYGTGGPKELEKLYTPFMLKAEFAGFDEVNITEEELEMHEGGAHAGKSAVIGMTCRRPRAKMTD